MTLRQLQYFVALSEERSFRKAADRLHISQPALSRAVSALEADVGVALLERWSAGIRLTAAGAALLLRAREMLRLRAIASGEARAVAAGRLGSLGVGYTDEFLHGELARRLVAFIADAKEIRVTLEFGYTPELTARVDSGLLDAALIVGPELSHFRNIKTIDLGRVPLRLVVPRDHRIARRKSANLREVAQERFVLPRTEPVTGFSTTVVACFQRASIAPAVLDNIFPSDMIVNLVAAGVGVTIMTANSASLGHRGVTALALTDEYAAISLAIVINRNPSALSQSLVDAMRMRGAGEHQGVANGRDWSTHTR